MCKVWETLYHDERKRNAKITLRLMKAQGLVVSETVAIPGTPTIPVRSSSIGNLKRKLEQKSRVITHDPVLDKTIEQYEKDTGTFHSNNGDVGSE